jgi:hypothetical protein
LAWVDGVCREACCLAHRPQGLHAGRFTARCTFGPRLDMEDS